MKTFLDAEKNDNFFGLRGVDLKELLTEVQTYFLEYREILNLPIDITFGVELEYEGVTTNFTTAIFMNKMLPDWKLKKDRSLILGGEITSPVMIDNKRYWQELQTICAFLKKQSADTLHNAGGHIHIGASILGSNLEAWKTFLKLYMTYEGVIFRFAYGDKISGRTKIIKYAPPIADDIKKNLKEIEQAKKFSELQNILISKVTKNRYVALNFLNVVFNKPYVMDTKNTLEFRSPNATIEPVIWQNNINTFAKMLYSSKEDKINLDFLNKQFIRIATTIRSWI